MTTLSPARLALLRIVVVGLLTTLPLSAAPKPDHAAITQAVLATNDQMTAAANRLDADAFFAYILDSDKGLIIQNGTIFKNRAEAFAAVKRGFEGIAKLERKIDAPQVTVVSPELALLTGEGNATATLADGRVLTSHFAVSVVFQYRDGRWKVLHGHYSTPMRM